jgi:hypothetical protein
VKNETNVFVVSEAGGINTPRMLTELLTLKIMKNVLENKEPYSDLSIIKAKDLAELIGCSEKTAFKYLKDIKEEYHLKRVHYFHVKKYLAIA